MAIAMMRSLARLNCALSPGVTSLLCLKGQHRIDQLEAVLNTMVDLLHEEVLLAEQYLLLRQRPAQPFVDLPQLLRLQELVDRASESARGLDLDGRPGLGLVVNRFLPDFERLPRVQLADGRAGLCRLVGVACPVDRLELLGAKPQENERL
jgi:hypothetical protein